jgi:uncharacterized protein (DUF983 family)
MTGSYRWLAWVIVVASAISAIFTILQAEYRDIIAMCGPIVAGLFVLFGLRLEPPRWLVFLLFFMAVVAVALAVDQVLASLNGVEGYL